jgi:hypothetical protein
MKVRLSLLDRQATLHYSKEVPIHTFIDRYKNVGTCKVFRGESGRHFGELELEEDVSTELYFYYRNMCNDADIFVFAGLDLMENPIENRPSTQLKDMIVD